MALVLRCIMLPILSLGLGLASMSCSKQKRDSSITPTKAKPVRAAAMAEHPAKSATANKDRKQERAAKRPSDIKDNRPGHSKTQASGSSENKAQPPLFLKDDIPGAMAQARKKQLPLFISFTAKACKDCRFREKSVFPRPEIRRYLDQMVLVSARTDCAEQVCKEQRDFASQRFSIKRFEPPFLPFYAVIDPHTDLVLDQYGNNSKQPIPFKYFLNQAIDLFEWIKRHPQIYPALSASASPKLDPMNARASSTSKNRRQPLLFRKNDIPGARAEAQEKNLPLFVNFSGYPCTNCRIMEVPVFARPETHSRLKQMVRVTAYTDGEEQVCEEQRDIQINRFDTAVLPFFAVFDPYTDEVLATFGDMTHRPKEYEAFLQAALDKYEEVKPKTRSAKRRALARARKRATRKTAMHPDK